MSGYSKLLILIAGNKGHGKDALADVLTSVLPDTPYRDSYAAPLKVCVHLKTGIPMDVLNDPSKKEDVRFGRYGQTPRKLMQDEGEEARKRISPMVWRDRLIERVEAGDRKVTIITDARHPEEEITGLREGVKKDTFVLAVRIVRKAVPVTRGHPSEDKIADVSDSLFDVVIANDGTLDDLRAAAWQLADYAYKRVTGEKPIAAIAYDRLRFPR